MDIRLGPLPEEITLNIKNKNTPVSLTGAFGAGAGFIVKAISKELKRPAVVIAENAKEARRLFKDLSVFDKGAVLFPPKDIVFYSADVYSREIDAQRLSVMESILKGEKRTIIMSSDAALSKFTPKAEFEKFVLEINSGDILPPEEAVKRLIDMGYERCDMAEGKGMFALRGGILDIFPATSENPVRIEFWDDEVDSLRIIDPSSQRSVENIMGFTVYPATDAVYTRARAEKALEKYRAEYENMKKYLKDSALDNLMMDAAETMEMIEHTGKVENPGVLINYFYDKPETILDYITDDYMVFVKDPERTGEFARAVNNEFDESYKGRLENGRILPSQMGLVEKYDELLRRISSFDVVTLSAVTGSGEDFVPKAEYDINCYEFDMRPGTREFFNELNKLKRKKLATVLLAGSRSYGEKAVSFLNENGIDTGFTEDLENKKLKAGTVTVTRGFLSNGFVMPDIGIAIINASKTEQAAKKRKGKAKAKGAKIESFTDLKAGDYVVHDNHGIGVYGGLEKINVEGISKDYMKITYRDGGNLYVPVNQMDLIQKYIGAEGTRVKLNKLGGQDWAKAKTKVKAAVSIMADELIALYAKRLSAKGFYYSADNVWQREFEEKFPYEETDDQLLAIEDVKKDMETGRVMDRLICGDVGYGKTEVAVRAAFKAVQDGKQVAYLVPTTILAQQHFNTFTERMEGYPVTVSLLSRFNTPKEQKETLKNVEKGFVDIVIGTHRLLSKDVNFKDLGLIIVDEEQRFGVGHKEKLKKMRENVNVLTLTATPIPRTLHMSLSGIRDMSLLEEPPRERRPVQTFVMEADSEFIKEAIRRELSRNGQVYYLHNRVNNIAEAALRLRKLVPEANVAFAHGQMSENELESVMTDFINGSIDVLVCTTIIETGLDIPNANTIIINDADKMGLSQLYQLRGRVGRANRSAYAYLLYRKDKALKEISEKRLQTIKEFTEFGSG
ncbi:MAG: transcription-repair coupling factor, partial [Lachnospiraceae bacterium]|nr:transcription-repair coupling factor [Lachnospiraceae bacterium]